MEIGILIPYFVWQIHQEHGIRICVTEEDTVAMMGGFVFQITQSLHILSPHL
jgi:hypothetical protein